MHQSKMKRLALAAGFASVALGSRAAMAGTGGDTEFGDIYDQISGWTEGTLGKTLGVSALLVGLGLGVIKQSVMSAVVGVAMALVAGFGPGIIDSVTDAGLAVTAAI